MSEPQSPKAPAGVEYTFPEKLRGPKDPKTILVAELTLEQEEDAERAVAGAGNAGTAAELVKRAIVAVDGKPVDWAGDGPEWYDRASPKIRELSVLAYKRVNRTTSEEDATFLASAVAKSG